MHKLETVPENVTHKIFSDLAIKMNYIILARILKLLLIDITK